MYNFNNLFLTISNAIIDDNCTFVKYITISFFSLLIINLNILFLKKTKKHVFPLMTIIKLNSIVLINTILLLYTYDLLFHISSYNLMKQSIELKYNFYIDIDLLLILQVIWFCSFMIIVLISFNLIKKYLQILFSSFFIGLNSYFINLWIMTDIDAVVLDTYFIRWTKIINKDLLYNKVLNISSDIKNNKLSNVNIIDWVNSNINKVYIMNKQEIYNSLVEENNKKITLYKDLLHILELINEFSFCIGSFILLGSISIICYKYIQFAINLNINSITANDNIYLIEDLVKLADEILANNNLGGNGINTICNFMLGLYRILRSLSYDITDDVDPRLIDLENQISEIYDVLEKIIEALRKGQGQ